MKSVTNVSTPVKDRFLLEFLFDWFLFIEVEQVDLSLTGVDTSVTDFIFLWTCVDLLDVGIGLKKHKGSKNREESSLYRQKDLWKALGGSLVVG
ncbi:hypothetical protein Taro_008522 [Colocasia esculenta]|uniref:Uncharacterized protein n=1 Tax=Colocasia esculenta TaxID=4460 RepID=A0A843U222_COLES|nr:hypothetical protein [Colocasia esculenta]